MIRESTLRSLQELVPEAWTILAYNSNLTTILALIAGRLEAAVRSVTTQENAECCYASKRGQSDTA
jgi:hypothetical protein